MGVSPFDLFLVVQILPEKHPFFTFKKFPQNYSTLPEALTIDMHSKVVQNGTQV
jgi:hypothetical protein